MPKAIEQQIKHNDCGITAVKIIYNLINIVVSRNYIEENIHLDENGSSLQDIRNFFDKQQFTTEYRLLDLNAIRADPKMLNNSLPGILPVKTYNGQHFVVVKGIRNKKIEILDPAKGQTYLWTFSELANHAHHATGNYDWVNSKDILDQVIKTELEPYSIPFESFSDKDKAEVINKLTYFSYVKQNFGFTNATTEKAFLNEILFNQEINLLPKQFHSLSYKEFILKIKAPVILSIKKPEEWTPPVSGKQQPEKPMNAYMRLFKELNSYRKVWGIYFMSTLFAALLVQITIFTNQILIDHILPSFSTHLVILFAIGFGVFKLFNLALTFYKNFIAIHLANILDNYFLSSFIEKLNTLPIRHIHTYSRGDLTERIKDSLSLKTFFIRFFTRMMIDGFVMCYALLVLFIIDWQITFIIVGILSIFIIWLKYITPYIRENEKRRFLEKSNLFSSLFENIDGLQVIKSFRIESLFMQRLAPRIKNILSIQKRVRFVSVVNSAVIEFIIVIATVVILILLSVKAIDKQTITTGQVITFIALCYQIFSSVSNILDENLNLQENGIILSRYFDFSKHPQKEVPRQLNKITDFSLDSIEFRNVSFHYIPDKPVFTNLNFKVSKGEKIKLEGGNGTGKSTLCKVLSLLYDAEEGYILVNNEKQVFYNQSSLRRKILLVSNEDILFNDTIAFNISFDHNSKTSVLLNLARDIGLYDFISGNEDGLEFIITEQGRNLSTGQRKKILFMRALFSNAELIIFDEIFSGIDKESVIKIEDYLNNNIQRSFIIISHEPIHHLKFSKKLMMHNGTIEQLQYQGA